MSKSLKPVKQSTKSTRPLRLGFVPLSDCAPLVMAHELGLFARQGLKVELKRELGWATIRDKIIYGELDAAHAVAGLPFAATLGLGSIACECVTGLVLSLHGNAITLSRNLWDNGVRDAKSLRETIVRSRGKKTYTFGVAFPFSSHNFLLRQWLASARINPDQDVRIVVVPPPQMFANLEAGNLDGYCVGEPWNSVAVQQGAGWCVATSSELAPGHVEKVLLVRRRFAEERSAEHLALIVALIEACAYCDQPENADSVIQTLRRPEYLNTTAVSLRSSMLGPFNFGHGRLEKLPGFHVFHRHGANEPSSEKAAWIMQMMLRTGLVSNPSLFQSPGVRRIFRADIFRQAQQLSTRPHHHENESKAENEFSPA
jgi:ABC-type nitrate/sulfonate/bicarbonate transport system substrate-binding protein